MTVQSATSRADYDGNGVTVDFAVPFRFLDKTHLQVIRSVIATGVETVLTLDSGGTDGYTVTGAGSASGGEVTVVTPPVGAGDTQERITILRDVPATQLLDFIANDAFPAESHERVLDQLTMLHQQQGEVLDRAMVLPAASVGVSATLPAPDPGKVLAWSITGDGIENADASGTGDMLLRGDLASSASGKGGFLVAFLQSGTGAVARWIMDKLRGFVEVEDFNVSADGVTDDGAKIANAMARAVARGVPLHFDGSKSYAIGTAVVVPAGCRLRTNGCTFVDKVGAGTSNSLLLDFEAGVEVDRLNITIGSGITRQRCVRFTGANNRVGDVTITYTDQQTGDDVTDAAVRFTNCTNLTVGMVTVAKHDRAATYETCTGVTTRGLDISSYLRGLYLLDVKDCHIGRSRLLTASPFASVTAGHVGVLIESASTDATRNVTLEDFHIENAGEHGIRISGPEQLSNIRLVRPSIKSVGASGIKILGTDTGTPTSRNKRIYIIDPIIEDVGTANSNRCGILAQFCDEVYITHPMIRKQSGANSAHTGIRLTSCTNVHIVHPHCMDAVNYGIWLDGSEGDIDQVLITGGMVRANGDIGFRANTQTATFRRIHVSDLLCSSNTNFGASFGATGGTALDCEMKLQIAGSTSAIACDTASVYLDGSGALGVAPLSGVTARNGSRWSDGTTLNIRKAGAWTAL
jgi:hypothetical protein